MRDWTRSKSAVESLCLWLTASSQHIEQNLGSDFFFSIFSYSKRE